MLLWCVTWMVFRHMVQMVQVDNYWHLSLERCKACQSLFRCCICSGFSMQSRCVFPESRENGRSSFSRRCLRHVLVPEFPCTNVQSADVQKLQIRSWNSAIAANASAIGNTVRIICLRISMCDNDYKIFWKIILGILMICKICVKFCLVLKKMRWLKKFSMLLW